MLWMNVIGFDKFDQSFDRRSPDDSLDDSDRGGGEGYANLFVSFLPESEFRGCALRDVSLP